MILPHPRKLCDWLHRKRAILGELFRFGVVGVISNLVYFIALPVLAHSTKLGLSSAASVAYVLSMVANYILQRRVTFKSRSRHREAIWRYLMVQTVGLVLNAALLEVLVTRRGLVFLIGQGADRDLCFNGFGNTHCVGLGFLIGQAVALVVVSTWTYVVQKLWVF